MNLEGCLINNHAWHSLGSISDVIAAYYLLTLPKLLEVFGVLNLGICLIDFFSPIRFTSPLSFGAVFSWEDIKSQSVFQLERRYDFVKTRLMFFALLIEVWLVPFLPWFRRYRWLEKSCKTKSTAIRTQVFLQVIFICLSFMPQLKFHLRACLGNWHSYWCKFSPLVFVIVTQCM